MNNNAMYSESVSVASLIADERALATIRNERFHSLLHDAQDVVWDRLGIEVDNTAMAFGESAHFSQRFEIPDVDPLKLAAVYELMAMVLRGGL